MGLRPWPAALLVGALCIAAVAWLVPLAARDTRYPSIAVYRALAGNGSSYKFAQEWMLFTPIIAGIVIITLCMALWGWLVAMPKVLRYRPTPRPPKA
jgi:uncharacterized membrane protein